MKRKFSDIESDEDEYGTCEVDEIKANHIYLEGYVVAVSIDGTSGRPLVFTGISDTNIAGFPVNPQTQTATNIRFCCRIY